MGEFVMPSLGADMEAGTVLEWRVQPGDTVHRGDIVAVVDTEKSTIEVEVFEDGVVAELLVDPGEQVPVGTPLARLDPLPTAAPAPPPPAPRPAATPRRQPAATPSRPAPAAPGPQAGPRSPAGRPAGRRPPATRRGTRPRVAPERPWRRPVARRHVRSSPLARRRAATVGIDLASLTGTGPDGAVVAADVDRATRRRPPATAPGRGPGPEPVPVERPGEVEPGAPSGAADRQQSLRRAVARLMARSNRDIPHYHLATTIDMATALTWLRAGNERRPVAERLLPGALLLKATAVAATEVPAMNGHWDNGFRPSAAVHLGVAVSLRGGGLVAPALRDADRLTLDELMAALRDVVGRARAGRLRSSEMTDPTITVTNLGDQGVDEVHGVIYPPQVALVGFGRIAERPWAADGMLGVRPTVRATLAADHRASDGMVGARFLAALDRILQTPEDL